MKCLYCDNETSDPHFVSDCCGRGMCEDCYQTLKGTDEQWQLSFADDEDIDRVKPKYRDADYLCFECEHIWKITN